MIDSLKTVGISGAVTFKVEDETYYEQMVIPAISGASTQNTIRFNAIEGASQTNSITIQSNALDSSKVRLYYPSVTISGNNYILWLEGADYIHLCHSTFERTGELAPFEKLIST